MKRRRGTSQFWFKHEIIKRRYVIIVYLIYVYYYESLSNSRDSYQKVNSFLRKFKFAKYFLNFLTSREFFRLKILLHVFTCLVKR